MLNLRVFGRSLWVIHFNTIISRKCRYSFAFCDFNSLIGSTIWIYHVVIGRLIIYMVSTVVINPSCVHDDVIKCTHFPRYWPFMRPAQRPITRSFGVFFDLHLNERLSKQSCGWWFGMPSRSLWCHCNDGSLYIKSMPHARRTERWKNIGFHNCCQIYL